MRFPIDLFGDLVAIRHEQPKFERGKVLLPDWQRTLRGTVVGKGPSVSNEIQKGTYVVFGAAKGMDSVCDGVEIRILREKDIDAVLE